ncbi:MAG: GYD domain-containing protein [Syntrophobacteraceae bacterium]|jgi:uncharacterized protein with GYD domain
MPKYLAQGNYVGDGLKGLLKDGGSGRRAAVEKLFKSLGGTVESWYYTFGEYDFLGIMDVPDNVTLASIALTVRSSGLVTVKTTVLMTPEEMDEAVKKSPVYRAPGQ